MKKPSGQERRGGPNGDSPMYSEVPAAGRNYAACAVRRRILFYPLMPDGREESYVRECVKPREGMAMRECIKIS